jgi:hypothetical protein
MSSSINPKSCNYGCNTQIYWNTSENTYFEVFTKKKHICPNRSSSTRPTTATRPTYYNKKPWSNSQQQPKPKMSNSFESLTGPIDTIQKKYEMLSDIVSEYNGKVHGSQSHIVSANTISLIVYFEVPEGKREEVKIRFKNSIIVLHNK